MRGFGSAFGRTRMTRGFSALDPALIDALVRAGKATAEVGVEVVPGVIQGRQARLQAEQQARADRAQRRHDARIAKLQSELRPPSPAPPAAGLPTWAWVLGSGVVAAMLVAASFSGRELSPRERRAA